MSKLVAHEGMRATTERNPLALLTCATNLYQTARQNEVLAESNIFPSRFWKNIFCLRCYYALKLYGDPWLAVVWAERETFINCGHFFYAVLFSQSEKVSCVRKYL